MKAGRVWLDLREKAIAEFLEGKLIREVASGHEFGFMLRLDDGSMISVDIDLDIAGDPYFRYALDGHDPYKDKTLLRGYKP